MAKKRIKDEYHELTREESEKIIKQCQIIPLWGRPIKRCLSKIDKIGAEGFNKIRKKLLERKG